MASSSESRLLRLVVVGDSGVGKTSLVSARVTGAPAPEQPAPTVLPFIYQGGKELAQWSGGRNFAVRVVDTSNKPQDFPAVQKALRTADVVVVVYDGGQDSGTGAPVSLGDDVPGGDKAAAAAAAAAGGGGEDGADAAAAGGAAGGSKAEDDGSGAGEVPSVLRSLAGDEGAGGEDPSAGEGAGLPAGSFARVTQFWLPLIRRARALSPASDGAAGGASDGASSSSASSAAASRSVGAAAGAGAGAPGAGLSTPTKGDSASPSSSSSSSSSSAAASSSASSSAVNADAAAAAASAAASSAVSTARAIVEEQGPSSPAARAAMESASAATRAAAAAAAAASPSFAAGKVDVDPSGFAFSTVPILLVGNKVDQRSAAAQEPNAAAAHKIQLRTRLLHVASRFPEVETVLECSAAEFRHVDLVFDWSQKVVLFPRPPLFNAREGYMRRGCIVALKRIFRLCDLDHDDVLSDAELRAFQRRCFDTPMPAPKLEEIKGMIARHTEDGVRDGGITLSGFIFMHYTAIMQQKLEMLWRVLRCFGYGDELRLVPDGTFPRSPALRGVLSSEILPHHSVPKSGSAAAAAGSSSAPTGSGAGSAAAATASAGGDSSAGASSGGKGVVAAAAAARGVAAAPWRTCTELSPTGVRFLMDLFRQFDADADGALSPEEIGRVFDVAPGFPWDKNVLVEVAVTDGSGYLTLQGWLALWHMTVLLQPRKALTYFAYLGFADGRADAAAAAAASAAATAAARSGDGVAPSVAARLVLGHTDILPSPVSLAVRAAPGVGSIKMARSNLAAQMQKAHAAQVDQVVPAAQPHALLPAEFTPEELQLQHQEQVARALEHPVTVLAPHQRSVVSAAVFGSRAADRNAFVNALVGKTFEDGYIPSVLTRSVCNRIVRGSRGGGGGSGSSSRGSSSSSSSSDATGATGVDSDPSDVLDEGDAVGDGSTVGGNAAYLVLHELGDLEADILRGDPGETVPLLQATDIAVVLVDLADPFSLQHAKAVHNALSGTNTTSSSSGHGDDSSTSAAASSSSSSSSTMGIPCLLIATTAGVSTDAASLGADETALLQQTCAFAVQHKLPAVRLLPLGAGPDEMTRAHAAIVDEYVAIASQGSPWAPIIGAAALAAVVGGLGFYFWKQQNAQ